MSAFEVDNEGSHVTNSDKVNDEDDDEEDDEVGADGTTTETDPEPLDRRDEVGEVRKMSSKDTDRLRLWRIVVTGVLLLTAFAVTFTTYTLLKQQEDENFKTAVRKSDLIGYWSFKGHRSNFHFHLPIVFMSTFLFPPLLDSLQFTQFARTVGDAAVDQQQRMRQSFVDFANHVSSTAMDVNATWPLFRIPRFELHAGQFRLETGVEFMYCNYMIDSKDADEYLEFVAANYEESVFEGHMIRYGNLDRLNPVNFTPSFKIFGPNGTVTDTIDRPLRSALWQISPRKSRTNMSGFSCYNRFFITFLLTIILNT